MGSLLPAWARSPRTLAEAGITPLSGTEFDLAIDRTTAAIDGRTGHAITVNGTIPAPLLRWKEGDTVTMRVTNRLNEDSSIHWHGILLPFQMDGVPGVTFPGIRPGETFTYRFPVKQAGTYWYHSHSNLQEQSGHYGPLVIDPAGHDHVAYDREYVVVLSDWTFENPHRLFAKLKKMGESLNYQHRTIGDFFADVAEDGLGATVDDRLAWGRMRMAPTDISDVSGATYTFLVNGHGPEDNWTALFEPGERVRLRIINASAMTIFNVRIPGLPMTVVQADGLLVQPVETDEFQIGVAETYDVVVQPEKDEAYTLMCEGIARMGYGRATLAPRPGMQAPVPPLRPRPLLTMKDMGMGMDMDMGGHGGHGMAMTGESQASAAPMAAKMAGDAMTAADGAMDHGAMDHAATDSSAMAAETMADGMDHAAMDHAATGHGDTMAATGDMAPQDGMAMDQGTAVNDGMAMDHDAMAQHAHPTGPGVANTAMEPVSRLHERGIGLENEPHRVLVYTDLKSLERNPDTRPPGREMELHLTSNMERYMWSFDGMKFSEVTEPIVFRHGERLRLTMVNDTMMPHPIHLHGMFFDVVNGAGDHMPRKHTIIVKPGEKLSVDITAEAIGDWAFHCHLLYHMHAGMFRVVSVRDQMAEIME